MMSVIVREFATAPQKRHYRARAEDTADDGNREKRLWRCSGPRNRHRSVERATDTASNRAVAAAAETL
jgi:hypothetical protein